MSSIILELSPKEAELFVQFRKYQDAFEKLVQAGMFDVKRGEVKVDFDGEGRLMEVRVQRLAYKRERSVV